jgi:tRNA threonylcarbamoyladenosine biosynthesis protein TsaE
MELIYHLEQLKKTASTFWKVAEKARVIAFHGEMGSGKTTFIHALCDSKNVKDVVSSPTFAIINEYFYEDDGEKKIYHIDLYRLKNEKEAVEAGVEDCFYNDHLCLVEWPEKAASLLPADTLHVFIDAIDGQTRRLRIGDN